MSKMLEVKGHEILKLINVSNGAALHKKGNNFWKGVLIFSSTFQVIVILEVRVYLYMLVNRVPHHVFDLF